MHKSWEIMPQPAADGQEDEDQLSESDVTREDLGFSFEGFTLEDPIPEVEWVNETGESDSVKILYPLPLNFLPVSSASFLSLSYTLFFFITVWHIKQTENTLRQHQE